MIELIVVCIVSVVFGGLWVALCIDNMKSVSKGICMAVGLPFMIISMFGLFVYVIYCFHKVLS